MKVSVRVIFLSNLTTRVELRDGKRIFGDKKELNKQEAHANFVELAAEGLKLDVPPRMCAKGHRLEFEIEFKAPSRTIRFPAQGLVEGSESFLRSHDNVTIRFTRYDRTVWGMVTALFAQQQTAVHDLFEKLKGA